jgi:hypothetical protein
MQKREDVVFGFLDEVYGETQEIIYDAVLPEQSCSRKRPDANFVLPHRKLIVEVDENQHKADAYSCEAKRMNEVATSGEIFESTVFIRFNPDIWRDEGGKKRKVSMDSRFELLKDEVLEFLY